MTSAVVTGSTKGIGFALARELVRRGHDVAVSGRSQEAVDEAVGKLQPFASAGARVLGRPSDVSDAAQVQALWDLGCNWPDPLLSADVLTTAAIPHFRITERGNS